MVTKQVKDEMPNEYETFLEVLTQFRSQRCVPCALLGAHAHVGACVCARPSELLGCR